MGVILLLGIVGSASAVALAAYAITAPPVDRIPLERRRYEHSEQKPVLSLTTDYLVSTVDRLLREREWVPFRARELELAGLRTTPGSFLVTVAAGAVAAVMLIVVVTGNLLVGLLVGAVLVPGGAKLALRIATGRRRSAFDSQLDESIQMIAAALRAGHSFSRALDAVARDSQSPTAEEFSRVVNENRLGRDLVTALEQTAARMQSEDFRWVAEAVAVHRDTGGNLNEVLDRVGQTMRERNQVRRQITSLASEGRFSAVILMALPVVVGGFYSLINPGYMSPLFTEPIGRVLLAGSLVLYVVGGLWMRAIVNVKF